MHFQGSGCGISGVCEWSLTNPDPFLIQRIKNIAVQNDFTPDLEQRRTNVSLDGQWYTADGFDIGSHIITTNSVAAGNGRHHAPILISKAYGRSVIFQFTGIFNGTVDQLSQPVVKINHFVAVIGVSEGIHGDPVLTLNELLVAVITDPLSRGKGVCKLRVIPLQSGKFIHQTVILEVGNSWFIKNIIPVIVRVQFTFQKLNALIN